MFFKYYSISPIQPAIFSVAYRTHINHMTAPKTYIESRTPTIAPCPVNDEGSGGLIVEVGRVLLAVAFSVK